MPQIPRVMPMAAPNVRQPAAPPAPPAAPPPAEAAPVSMPDLPEGYGRVNATAPAHQRAAALMALLADPRAWWKD